MPQSSRPGSNPAYCYSQPFMIRPRPSDPDPPSMEDATKKDPATADVAMADTEDNKEPIKLTGSCYCRNLTYYLRLESLDDARTSLCHCKNCKKAFGGAFGLTAKVPLQQFHYTAESGTPTIHVADNGSGMNIYREFCNKCGSYTCEYGEQAKVDFRYLAVGSLDDPSALPPKGEFFCSQREEWMPEIPDIFHKQRIKE